MNPEFRQTLNTLSHNFETANQTAQENIYSFTQLYVDPCLAGFKSCVQDCTAPCLGNRDDPLGRRRGRGRSRGRAEHFFDFYDDWDDEEDAGHAAIAGWGNDELDSLLAGQGQTNTTYNTSQPQRQRGMSYGSRGRRKPHILQSDSDEVPVPIPGSNLFGFLERLPWNIGSRVLKYRPSAANLQENPGGLRMADAESQSPFPSTKHSTNQKGHKRQRSDTTNSRSTLNSVSSRGDLILSEEEEDAVPLDDEFAVLLGRRTTNTGVSEDHSSGKTGSSGRRPGPSGRGTRTPSSKSISKLSKRSGSQKSLTSPMSPSVEEVPPPPTQSMHEMRQEEDLLRKAEELEIEQKRDAAQKLAAERGLSAVEVKSDEGTDTPSMTEVQSPRPLSPMPGGGEQRRDTEPFPAFRDDRIEGEDRRDPP